MLSEVGSGGVSYITRTGERVTSNYYGGRGQHTPLFVLSKFRGIPPQKLKIGDAIGIAGENDLPGIPPLRNMMGYADNHDARQPCHSMKITEQTRSADNLCPEFRFVIPRLGGNNWGTSRLSPGFIGRACGNLLGRMALTIS
jgi:hypothetical protein